MSQTDGTTGWDALGVWGTVIAALAALTAPARSAASCRRSRESPATLLRYGALGCVGVVVWKLVDTPGANAELELRLGAFVAAAAALIAFSSGSAVASTPLRHRTTAPAAYTPAAAAAVRDGGLGAAARLLAIAVRRAPGRAMDGGRATHPGSEPFG